MAGLGHGCSRRPAPAPRWTEIAPGVPALRVLAEAVDPGHTPREDATLPAVAVERGQFEYDVFLCHNSKDKPEVRALSARLRTAGLRPWLDEDELQPGLRWIPKLESQIDSIRSAAVMVGGSGIGPWQDEEIDALLRRFKEKNRPVIPVMLESAPDNIVLPSFLDARTPVDFRKNPPDPMEQLIFGITGRNPRHATNA